MDDVMVCVSRGTVIRVCLYAVIFLLFLELSINFSFHKNTYKMVSSREILNALEDISRFALVVNFSDPCGWMQNATIRDLQKIRDRGCKPVRVCSSSPSDLGRWRLTATNPNNFRLSKYFQISNGLYKHKFNKS